MVRWILLFLLVFASSAGAADTRLPPVLHSVSAGPVTASFGGQETANDIPLRFAISHLWFTFDGDDQTYVFLPDKTPEEGDYRDWNFDIFSPNGQYVVLLLDFYGPYHIVSTAQLKDYLTKRAEPAYVVSGKKPDAIDAGIHSDATWISSKSIQFSFSCCATEQLMQFDLSNAGVKCLQMREATDAVKGPWKKCEP